MPWLPSRWLEGPPQSPSDGPRHHIQCSLLTLLSHSRLISLLSLTFQEEMSVGFNCSRAVRWRGWRGCLGLAGGPHKASIRQVTRLSEFAGWTRRRGRGFQKLDEEPEFP